MPSVHITEVSVLQSNHLNKETKGTVPGDCITEVSVLQLNLLVQTPLRQSQVSTSQRCLYYSQTSWYRHHWDRVKCPHYRGICITVKRPDTDTTETEPSVRITEVSVLQSDLLNMDTKGTEPSVCITDMTVLQSSLLIQTLKRQSQVSTSQRCLYYSQTWYRHDTKGTELSVLVTALVSVLQSNLHNMDTKGQNYITKVSVLQSNLLNTDTKGHVQVSTWQRSLFYSQISWYRHQRDRFKCLRYRGVCITVKPP